MSDSSRKRRRLRVRPAESSQDEDEPRVDSRGCSDDDVVFVKTEQVQTSQEPAHDSPPMEMPADDESVSSPKLPYISDGEEPKPCKPGGAQWQWPFHCSQDDYRAPTEKEREDKIIAGYQVFSSDEFYGVTRHFYRKSRYGLYPRRRSASPHGEGSAAGSREEPLGPVELARANPLEPGLLKTLISLHGQNKTLVVATKNGVQVNMELLKCLEKGKWLNSEVISFFIEWWRERTGGGGGSERANPTPGAVCKCWYTSTFFFTRLTENGYGHSAVKSWIPKDLFEYDEMIVPVNVNQAHWYTAVVNFRDKRTEVYDSQGKKHDRQETHATLRRWLADTYKAQHGKDLSLSEWRIHEPPPKRVPQQRNSNDCGVFMCLFAAHCSIDRPFTFTQGDIPLVREFITHVLYQSGVEQGSLQAV
jgi:hypothetical protein